MQYSTLQRLYDTLVHADLFPRLFAGDAPYSSLPLRFVVWLRCDRCHAGYFASAPVRVRQVCPACIHGHLVRVASWDLVTQARPGEVAP